MDYREYFRWLAAFEPHPWQVALGEEALPSDRQLRIPTGFGKTLGVLGPWLFHRLERNDHKWPLRLVWCLPMRVLVEQTEAEVRDALRRLDRLWSGQGSHTGKIGVHALMGGADAGDWHLYPEHGAVLIGTQDMLLSRAMNRGYGAHRARWPMDFGLLNQDCLWILDEVQLMDVGLATSGQLQSFRSANRGSGRQVRPCHSWWMSATMQNAWLQKSPEARELAGGLSRSSIPATERVGHLWDDVAKPLEVHLAKDTAAIAKSVIEAHVQAQTAQKGPTLVVLNRVDDAVDVFDAVKKDKRLLELGTEARLVHSRFRPRERKNWRDKFLNRSACESGVNRIIVATQVIEAGVDISSATLITDLAPWPSLVQRFGRAARWGGQSRLIVVDRQPKDDKASAPYAKNEVDAARAALAHLTDGAPLSLEKFEEDHPELLSELYPYAPKHLLLPHELDELFDTTPDLSGADIDISRFIRSGEERDLQVFWQDVRDAPPRHLRPARDSLCSVPFLKAQDWLCEKGTQRLKQNVRAWVWDWLEGEWRSALRRDFYPGQTILVDAKTGGYDTERGWNAASKTSVAVVEPAEPSKDELADSAQDDEDLSAYAWQTIAVHGAQVGAEARGLAELLCPERQVLLEISGRWHDVGKAHEAFQNSIASVVRPTRRDLAKAPDGAWLPVGKLYPVDGGGRRAGFRHELVSTLGLFAVLGRHAPDHPALLGPWKELLAATGVAGHLISDSTAQPNSVEREVLALSAEEFDLVAYLVCSHHGKVRVAWHASPADQEAGEGVAQIRGVREGDVLPSVLLASRDGRFELLPESAMTLAPAAIGLSPVTGRSWTDRVLTLVSRYSVFQLAYLEALLRVADIRASKQPVADPLLKENNDHHGLEGGDSGVEGVAHPGEGAPTLGADPGERGAEHGVRGGAGGSSNPQRGTRAPAAATGFVQASVGVLSYAGLAPRLAQRVSELEHEFEAGAFDASGITEDLLYALHARLCGDLVPQMAGWRQVDVAVGSHSPPSFVEVPVLMRQYADDLSVRLDTMGASEVLLLEALAFAEGRLLSIHPFVDFNGRATRLFLRLLLRRLDLPAVDLAPSEQEAGAYLSALAGADRFDWEPLIEVWKARFEAGDLS